MGMNSTNVEAPAGVVKYRLVEAEEVSDKPHGTSTSRAVKPKRKGKLNWSQFPMEGEDNVVAPEGHKVQENTLVTSQSNDRTRGWQQKGRRGYRSNGRFSGRRHYGGNNGSYVNGVYVPTPDVQVTAQWAKSQIEFYFTSDNLVRDIFLRQHMDVDGYVPLAFVGSFQAVYSVHQDYESLLEAMKHSDTIELDEKNEKIRLRTDWQKWVWPNAKGGYGVPRYIKQTESDSPGDKRMA
ncbi:RNA-binding protein LARP/SRO9 and related La domain proteins [Plasmopara halstedii]|uniref:RNA-binding protein LARP/SRO9 and related La domain proteins n=1 Tax=Plasmopara halstedii TaxID=4781 RepID=A0A0P1ANV9_PLAHL|nr:RNA-binding protein LARP/SRO9 and related La domain proteins [Plasmopara halstedii]CEG43130.1 RNA-binding protein LARP/SRO9 and related La domain proteins [Plasmopara halstedii]|eukprot:XP_024579499.1 RNA-binding protein LARP/SRO9 and related La domain proteins [Plasmopara halstedii]